MAPIQTEISFALEFDDPLPIVSTLKAMLQDWARKLETIFGCLRPTCYLEVRVGNVAASFKTRRRHLEATNSSEEINVTILNVFMVSQGDSTSQAVNKTMTTRNMTAIELNTAIELPGAPPIVSIKDVQISSDFVTPSPPPPAPPPAEPPSPHLPSPLPVPPPLPPSSPVSPSQPPQPPAVPPSAPPPPQPPAVPLPSLPPSPSPSLPHSPSLSPSRSPSLSLSTNPATPRPPSPMQPRDVTLGLTGAGADSMLPVVATAAGTVVMLSIIIGFLCWRRRWKLAAAKLAGANAAGASSALVAESSKRLTSEKSSQGEKSLWNNVKQDFWRSGRISLEVTMSMLPNKWAFVARSTLNHGPKSADEAAEVQEKYSHTTIDWSRMELQKLLGSGSMGKVFKVKLDDREQPCVVRRYDMDILMLSTHSNRIADVAALVDLPTNRHLLGVIGFAFDNTQCGVVMDYMPHSLAQLLSRVTAGTRNKLASQLRNVWHGLVVDIASGLSALHLLGLSHWALHPSNVMLDSHMVVKLTDYGRAPSVIVNRTHAGESQGPVTPSSTSDFTNENRSFYMPPEILSGKAFERSADLWSLGVIIVRLATLKVPYSSLGELSSREVLDRVATGEAAPGSELSNTEYAISEVGSIVAACTKLKPSSRPPIDEVLNGLNRIRRAEVERRKAVEDRATSLPARRTSNWKIAQTRTCALTGLSRPPIMGEQPANSGSVAAREKATTRATHILPMARMLPQPSAATLFPAPNHLVPGSEQAAGLQLPPSSGPLHAALGRQESVNAEFDLQLPPSSGPLHAALGRQESVMAEFALFDDDDAAPSAASPVRHIPAVADDIEEEHARMGSSRAPMADLQPALSPATAAPAEPVAQAEPAPVTSPRKSVGEEAHMKELETSMREDLLGDFFGDEIGEGEVNLKAAAKRARKGAVIPNLTGNVDSEQDVREQGPPTRRRCNNVLGGMTARPMLSKRPMPAGLKALTESPAAAESSWRATNSRDVLPEESSLIGGVVEEFTIVSTQQLASARIRI